jgi:glycosyltransferase involved in cell wall biosynthesis
MPVISIIVPVYNTEKYLSRCIDSILAQTFTDFECIIIDDGSSDNCPVICDKYAKEDNRIVLIHQENAGVSAARNVGLDRARGEWIGFVDSDDWCDPDMFRVLHENAIKYDADVSICRFKINSNDGIKKEEKNIIQILNGEQATLKIFTPEKYFRGFSFNKLIMAKLIFKNKLRYDPTIKYMEDLLFIYEVFKYTKKVINFLKPYYNYFINSESVTNQFGLTEEAKTAFFVFDKIISLENRKRIKNKVITEKVLFASNIGRQYILRKDYMNNDFFIIKKLIFNYLSFMLFDFSIPLKLKIRTCLLFWPYWYNKFNHVWYFINKRCSLK